jgi:hypothetical protein
MKASTLIGELKKLIESTGGDPEVAYFDSCEGVSRSIGNVGMSDPNEVEVLDYNKSTELFIQLRV